MHELIPICWSYLLSRFATVRLPMEASEPLIGSTEWWLATLATHGAEISSVKREKYAAVLGKLEWEPRHFDDVEDTKAQLRLAQIPEAGISVQGCE